MLIFILKRILYSQKFFIHTKRRFEHAFISNKPAFFTQPKWFLEWSHNWRKTRQTIRWKCDNLSGVYRGYAILLSCPYIFLIQHICLFSSPLILPLSQEIVYKCIHFMESARFMIERNAIKKDNIGLKQLFRLKSSQKALGNKRNPIYWENLVRFERNFPNQKYQQRFCSVRYESLC